MKPVAHMLMTSGVLALLLFARAAAAPPAAKPAQDPDLPAGWDSDAANIHVAAAVSRPGTAIFPQRVWIKRDGESTHILIKARGLQECLKVSP